MRRPSTNGPHASAGAGSGVGLVTGKRTRDGSIAPVSRRALAVVALGTGLASPAFAGEPAAGAPTKSLTTAATAGNAAASAPAAPSAAPAPPSPVETPPQDGKQAIADARRAVEDQRYEDALASLAPQLSSASRATRAAALEITAIVRLLLGRQAEGREAVSALYELAPGFALEDPSLPPRVTRVFDAEAALPHGRSVTMAIRPADGERGLFEVSVTQPAGSIDLACSAAKPPAYAPVAVKKSDVGLRFRLPTLAAHRCFAIARDAAGLPLGRLGSASRPVDVTPPPPAAPLATRWWLWTAIGVVAAALVTGVVAVTQQPQRPPEADLTVRPQRAVLSW